MPSGLPVNSLLFSLVTLPLLLFPITLFFCRTLTPKYSYWKTTGLYAVCYVPFQSAGILLSYLHACGRLPSFHPAAFHIAECIVLLLAVHLLMKTGFLRNLALFAVLLLLAGAAAIIGKHIAGWVVRFVHVSGRLNAAGLRNLEAVFIILIQAILLTFVSGVIDSIRWKRSVKSIWTALFLFLLLQIMALVFAYLRFSQGASAPDIHRVALYCIYTAVCLLSDILLVRAFRSTVENGRLKQNIDQAVLRWDMEAEQARNLKLQSAAIAHMRETYAQALVQVRQSLQSGEPETALAVTSGEVKRLDALRVNYTNNVIVDAVLYSKSNLAKERNVHFAAHMLWPETLLIRDVDMMSIFSNMLDNALEYCASLPPEIERSIEVVSRVQQDLLVLRFRNTYLGDAPPDILHPQTTKSDGKLHGNGILIVRTIARKYNGSLNARCLDGMLQMDVLLCNLPAEGGA